MPSKIVSYTLNLDGTVPDYIIDGGHLGWPNSKPFPQSLDLIGVATDQAPQPGFASEADLLSYAQIKGLSYLDTATDTIIPLEEIISSVWAKLIP
jgi:hypothetical protein